MKKSTRINGNNALAIAHKDGVDYRLDSIEEFIPITIKNLKKGVAYRIDLSDYLDQDYRFNVATFDLLSDDDERLEDYDDQEKERQRLRLCVKKIKNNIPISQQYFIIWSSGSNIPFTFLGKDEIIVVQADVDVNSITFYAKPVLLNKPINLAVDNSFNADTEPANTI